MSVPARPAASALLAAALILGAAEARAAEVQVGPVIVTLTPGTKSAVVTLTNQGKSLVRFELEAKAWRQSPAGEMELSPTDEIAVYPPVLSVPPDEEKILRVGAVTPFGPEERSYRIVIQELAPPETPEAGAQVRMLTRILIPVFVGSTKPVEKASLVGLAVRGGKVTVRLSNEGTVHVRPDSVRLVGLGDAGKVAFEKDLPAWYVLPGGVRDYEAIVPKEACANTRELEVSATLGKETLRTRIANPGPCAP